MITLCAFCSCTVCTTQRQSETYFPTYLFFNQKVILTQTKKNLHGLFKKTIDVKVKKNVLKWIVPTSVRPPVIYFSAPFEPRALNFEHSSVWFKVYESRYMALTNRTLKNTVFSSLIWNMGSLVFAMAKIFLFYQF